MADSTLKTFPYRPRHRHEYWYIDLHYLRQLDGQWTNSVCVLEGYSRKLLAGMASEYQDEIAVLQLLTAALSEYGCPAKLVSDNGAVFTAQAYCGLLETLGIEACYIEKGQPWEDLIEAQFKVQLRLADHKFEQARRLKPSKPNMPASSRRSTRHPTGRIRIGLMGCECPKRCWP